MARIDIEAGSDISGKTLQLAGASAGPEIFMSFADGSDVVFFLGLRIHSITLIVGQKLGILPACSLQVFLSRQRYRE